MTIRIIALAALVAAAFTLSAHAQVVPPDDTPGSNGTTLSRVVDGVNAANFKTTAEIPASAANVLNMATASAMARLLNTATDNYAAMSAINQAATSVSVKGILSMDPTQALTITKGIQSNTTSEILTLISALTASRQATGIYPVPAPKPE